MILFDLRCSQGHDFEAWFRDSKSYDQLAEAGEVVCAICGDTDVTKALMAPHVRTRKASAPPTIEGTAKDVTATDQSSEPSHAPQAAVADRAGGPDTQLTAKATTALTNESSAYPAKMVEAMKMLRQAQTFIEKNFEPVGKNFAEEARKIHYGEADKRNIYGEATKEEAKSLADEGIEVNQMPWLPSRDS